MKKFCTKCGHELEAIGREVICPACKGHAAEEATRTAALSTVLTPELEKVMLRHTPLERLGETADIARAVLFLCSPASSWISGQTLMVNGGGSQTLD